MVLLTLTLALTLSSLTFAFLLLPFAFFSLLVVTSCAFLLLLPFTFKVPLSYRQPSTECRFYYFLLPLLTNAEIHTILTIATLWLQIQMR
jgi:hypothetical protein